MGIITRMFRRNLSEEEKQEKSRREQEWAQKCYNKGEQFAEHIALDKYVGKVNEFANKYPRTFFLILFGGVIVSILFNNLITLPSQNLGKTVEELQQTSMMQPSENPTSELAAQMLEISENLKEIDGKITAITAKDTLTHQDSLDIRSLLLQAQALQQIIEGSSRTNAVDTAKVRP